MGLILSETRFFLDFDTLLNSNRPQGMRFQDTRFILDHSDRVPRGLTVHRIDQ